MSYGGAGDDAWAQESYQNGAGYDDGSGTENYQMEEQGEGGYDAAGGGAGYAAVQGEGPPVQSQHNQAESLFRSEEMALCQLFLQVRIPSDITKIGF